jgi:hypothetical protein
VAGAKYRSPERKVRIRGAASGATRAMETVLVHHGHAGGHFGDLMPDRFGILAVEVLVTGPTGGWLALNDLPELLGGDQGAGHTAMTGLSDGAGRRWLGRGRRPRSGRTADPNLIRGGRPELIAIKPIAARGRKNSLGSAGQRFIVRLK